MGEELEARIRDVYSVYRVYTRCEEELRRTRPLSLRVPKLVWKLYDDVLDSRDKEVTKAVLEATIIALAKQRAGSLPCAEELNARLSFNVTRATGTPSVVFNINVSMSKAMARAEARVLVKVKGLVEELYRLRHPLPPKQRELIEQLYKTLAGVSN